GRSCTCSPRPSSRRPAAHRADPGVAFWMWLRPTCAIRHPGPPAVGGDRQLERGPVMAEESGQPAPGSSGGRVTRRQLLTGATAAGVGGLVVGGVGGYLAGNASASNESQTPTA